MKNITMKEIAELADVSQPTVSRVINGKPGVSDQVTEKVLQVIKEVGYTPNRAAQTLKRNNSHLIGVCVSEIYNPYFVELIDYIEIEARKKDYNIIFQNSKHNPLTEWQNIKNLMARQVDGIIFVPTSDYNIKKIQKLNIPTISVTSVTDSIDSISLDHIKGGEMVAKKFISDNHKTFGYIGNGNLEDEKYLGYKNYLAQNGFTLKESNCIQVKESSTKNYMIERYIEDYFNRMITLDFTCIFTANDILAIEFMKAAEKRNIKIPEDISLIGFDDTYLAKIMNISSIHQPVEEMVKNTFDVLFDRMNNDVSSDPIKIQLEPLLINRNSSNHIRKK